MTDAAPILVINAGSSSVRLAVFARRRSELSRLLEIHEEGHDLEPGPVLRRCLEAAGPRFAAVVHRVVHGGTELAAPCLVDARVEERIAAAAPWAPLHNPVALRWLRASREILGAEVVQIAVFDTGFYAALPEAARTYALPRELCERHGIRRYGFHGIAHRALWQRYRTLHPDTAATAKVISLQLGAGCSATALMGGSPVDTSMGFSPLEGLVMATRGGDLDPGLVTYVQRAEGLTPEAMDRLLNRESGLRGLSGISGDMRVLLQSDDGAARLAVAVFCYRARKYIGAYAAALGGLDAVLFGGGIGEHAPRIRAQVLEGMDWCGVRLDEEKNQAALGKEACISAPDTKVEVWVIPVDEAQMLAREALAVLNQH